MTADLQQRFRSLTSDDSLEDLHLSLGSMADYGALKEHHYKSGRPATATRVLTLTHTRHTPSDRFTETPANRQPVAVLVESLPSLACTMRNYALNDRYGNWLPPRARATLINREIRLISRVVVHPCWRGIGLAVRLVKSALQTQTTLYTEALAAMGRVSPFLERAGMTAYPRPRHEYDDRLIEAMHFIGLEHTDLSATDRVNSHINVLSAPQRDWFHKELHRWYRQNGGRSSTHSTDPVTHLIAARQRLMLEPVYYLHDNTAQLRGTAQK